MRRWRWIFLMCGNDLQRKNMKGWIPCWLHSQHLHSCLLLHWFPLKNSSTGCTLRDSLMNYSSINSFVAQCTYHTSLNIVTLCYKCVDRSVGISHLTHWILSPLSHVYYRLADFKLLPLFKKENPCIYWFYVYMCPEYVYMFHIHVVPSEKREGH